MPRSICLRERCISHSDIGAKVVTCHPGTIHRQTQRQLIDRLIDSLNRVPRLPRADLDLCVETMGAQRPAQTLLELDSQLEVCQRVGTWVCADVPHVASVLPETPALLGGLCTLAPYIRQVHLADTALAVASPSAHRTRQPAA